LNNNNNKLPEATTKVTTTTIPQSWRVRDSIYAILSSRLENLPKNLSEDDAHIMITAPARKKKRPWKRTNRFDVEESLSRKADEEHGRAIAQAAFHAAATCLLRALARQRSRARMNLIDAMTSGMADRSSAGAIHHAKGEDKASEEYLPSFVTFLRTLGDQKDKSMDLAMKNRFMRESLLEDAKKEAQIHLAKEATNKKRKDIDGNTYTVLDSSSSKGTSPASKTPLKKFKKEDGNEGVKENDNIKQDDECKGVLTKTSESSKKDTDSSNDASSKVTTPSKNSASETKGKDGTISTPIYSTYTPSQFSATHASTTNLDSRAAVSRAILCAAASLTFKRLTPDFTNDEKEATIDVLNIPQNPHAPDRIQVNGDKDNDENHEEDSSRKRRTETKKSAAVATSNINMGAVIMSAEIFANRSVEQAEGAARRSDKRRRWRASCISRDLSLNENQYCTDEKNVELSSGAAIAKWLNLKNAYRVENMVSEDGEDSSSTDSSIEDMDEIQKADTDYKMNDDACDREGRCVEFLSSADQRHKSEPKFQTNNKEWSERCLPRILEILNTGPGHLVYHDMVWESRADRIAQILYGLANPKLFEGLRIKEETVRNGDEIVGDRHKTRVGNEGDSEEKRRKKKRDPNYGPHLIVTTLVDMHRFSNVLGPIRYVSSSSSSRMSSNRSNVVSSDDDMDSFTDQNDNRYFELRALAYSGSEIKRKRTRHRHMTKTSLGGLHDSPFHVIITTYETFVKDYVYFCKIPFQAVVMDDGMSWLGTAHFDPNGQLGKVWDAGVFSKSDNHAGLAGVGHDGCDFIRDDTFESLYGKSNKSESSGNSVGSSSLSKSSPLIGLSARHKILVASAMHSKYRDMIYPAPVPGLLSFLLPQFVDVVKEEWDRSRIQNCAESMKHVRKLLCRCIIVYSGYYGDRIDCSELILDGCKQLELPQWVDIALQSMSGDSTSFLQKNNDSTSIPMALKNYPDGEISTDKMISEGKIVQSRRFAASWLKSSSPIRCELGGNPVSPILNIMKIKSSTGHVCEEIVTASSMASGSGTSGGIFGPSAFTAAVRCGRSFTSEQGLRQHIAALHAPPGTWLCRSCGTDCGTSQARTHHERSCGTTHHPVIPGCSNSKDTDKGSSGGSTGGGMPTVGQGIGSSLAVSGATLRGKGANLRQKDEDGCFCVPGYRGVWVDKTGKHFVKVNGVALVRSKLSDKDNINEEKSSNDNEERSSTSKSTVILFSSADQAAKAYDLEIKNKEKGDLKSVELNFKYDGTRIVYDDTASNAGNSGRGLDMLGGGASSVVPALSVINIKDLPKGVVPLLRDPRQTSRTGGNSKRYIYAYRGVCRQARKGHDRWQSQISFGGTNHYLGTFDSEWDAAAIYAWAHLILYGEEATQKAQKEGEEAVAAWEQEKKDIAEGKIIAPPPKPEKRKRKPTPKSKFNGGTKLKVPKKKTNSSLKIVSQKQQTANSSNPILKNKKDDFSQSCLMTPSVHKNINLLSGKNVVNIDDNGLNQKASDKIVAAREIRMQGSSILSSLKSVGNNNICIPVHQHATKFPYGCLILVGLSADDFGFDVDNFFESARHMMPDEPLTSSNSLRNEYGSDGSNIAFRSVVHGAPCFIGRAGRDIEKAVSSIGFPTIEIGGSIGDIDCNIGGINGSCNEIAACISFSVSKESFQISACNNDDIVTLNGEQINSSMGCLPIRNEAICSVGCRVFMVVIPQASK